MFDMFEEITPPMFQSATGKIYLASLLEDVPNLYDLDTAQKLELGDKELIRFHTSALNRAIDAVQENRGLLKELSDKGYPFAQEQYIHFCEATQNMAQQKKYVKLLSENPYTVNGIRGIMQHRLRLLEAAAQSKPDTFKETQNTPTSHHFSPSQGNKAVRPFYNNGENLPPLDEKLNKTLHLSPNFMDNIENIHSDFNKQLRKLPVEAIEKLAHKGYPVAQYETAVQAGRNRHFKTARSWLQSCLKNPLSSDELKDMALDIYDKQSFPHKNDKQSGR